QMRAGAEPGMGRNRLDDLDPMSAGEAEIALHNVEIAGDAVALGPADLGRRCAFDGDAGRELADRDADAAEAAAEPAVEIEKAEVQARRNGDRHLDRVPRSDHLQASAPEVFIRRSLSIEDAFAAKSCERRVRGTRLRYRGEIGNRSRLRGDRI